MGSYLIYRRQKGVGFKFDCILCVGVGVCVLCDYSDICESISMNLFMLEKVYLSSGPI